MKKIGLTLAFINLLIVSVLAQANGQPIEKYGGKQQTLIEISNIAGDMATGCFRFDRPYVGAIVKRKFANDEITIIGFVIRSSNDERTYINIDDEQIQRMSSVGRSNFSSLLGIGKRVKVWVYGCGAAGRVLIADRIKAF
jgi:hypothetical protein